MTEEKREFEKKSGTSVALVFHQKAGLRVPDLLTTTESFPSTLPTQGTGLNWIASPSLIPCHHLFLYNSFFHPGKQFSAK
jgi:hypothetical protein